LCLETDTGPIAVWVFQGVGGRRRRWQLQEFTLRPLAQSQIAQQGAEGLARRRPQARWGVGVGVGEIRFQVTITNGGGPQSPRRVCILDRRELTLENGQSG